MSRSISQIYAEAVATRNDYLQISPLDSGKSNSKLSIINIMTYVVSAMIYSYEVVLDTFQAQIGNIIASRINGTADYYAQVAKFFQYNTETNKLDDMVIEEDTFKPQFATIDESKRIVVQSGYDYNQTTGVLTLKVCKEDTSGNADANYLTKLSNQEMTAFKQYIDKIKFIGTNIACQSTYGDIIKISCVVVFDDLYITADQALLNVQQSIKNYIDANAFNGKLYYQDVIDAIQSAEYVKTVVGKPGSSFPLLYVKHWDLNLKAYQTNWTAVNSVCNLTSGYIVTVDETAQTRATTINVENITFQPNSTYTPS